MDFVICSKVIKAAKGRNKYTYNLLMPLISDLNSHKIIKNDQILEIYKNLADECILEWIEGAIQMECWKEVACNEDPIFIKTCLKTYDKKLIVSEKEDYQDYEGLNPLNKDEAIEQIRAPVQINNYSIQQTGDGQISTGDHSSNLDH